MGATALATTLVKTVLARARPEWQSSVELLTTKSFPSAHASSVAAFAGVLVVLTWVFVRRSSMRRTITVLLVLGTSSSESALPHLMLKLEHLGCSRGVVGLVIPTGYSFNLDGTSIYLTMAAVFIAQACDIPLTLQQELTILAVLLLTSKGAAGVVGDAPLDESKIYRVAINDFMARGGDGYASFHQAPPLVPPADAPLLTNEVMRYIQSLGTARARVEGRIVVK